MNHNTRLSPKQILTNSTFIGTNILHFLFNRELPTHILLIHTIKAKERKWKYEFLITIGKELTKEKQILLNQK